MAAGALGDFLAAKRAATTPKAAGLVGTSEKTRRVPGLRRDELAMLANISVDYLARLEQGRERSPSSPVLKELARALNLSADECAHLHRLAGRAVETPTPTVEWKQVHRQLAAIIGTWPTTVAFVIDPVLDIHLMNPMAEALFSSFQRTDNLLAMVMLDPAGRDLYVDWDRACESCVAAIRASEHLARPEALERVVAELSGVERFDALWARHSVQPKTTATKVLNTVAGIVEVSFVTLQISGAPGWELVLYHAAPGSVSAHRLEAVGSLHLSGS